MCLAYLEHLQVNKYFIALGVDFDLPSSSRCCPTGSRESLVTMLLVIDV